MTEGYFYRRRWSTEKPLFEIRKSAGAAPGPVLLSVPHAGREYAPALMQRCRVPHAALQRMEDRYADLLIGELTGQGYTALVAHVPRVVIDLNRDPHDIDMHMVAGIPRNWPVIRSLKQRGGLGLFPRSLLRHGDLWRGAIEWGEAEDRISAMHGAYHDALEAEMNRIVSVYGQALLVDVHSMPPLPPPVTGDPRPDIVIGDRFGATVSGHLTEVACSAAMAQGLKVALNYPYAGAYMIERHGRPAQKRYAMQIEISRDLYLDRRLDEAGSGLPAMRAALTAIVNALSQAMGSMDWAEAAE